MGGAILTPNELVLTFQGSYVCANFGENRSRNATVRVLSDGQTHRQTHTHTDANRFYNLSHAICYSYGTDNYLQLVILLVNGHRQTVKHIKQCNEASR